MKFIAVTGTKVAHEYLQELGATKVVGREKLNVGDGILEKTPVGWGHR